MRYALRHRGREDEDDEVGCFAASIPIAYVDPDAAKWSWLSPAVLPRAAPKP